MLCCALLGALVAGAFPAGAQEAPAPPTATDLGTSPSGHYVTYRGRTLLLVGDSGTQCVLQDLNLDYRRWVADCHACGIPAVHVWSFVAPRQKQDGSVVEGRYGHVYPGATPWARRTDGPPATDQLRQWDLTRFDEGTDPSRHYWPRLRDLCAQTRARGMVLGITVFFGWPKHNQPEQPDWAYHPLNLVNGGFLTAGEGLTTVCQTIATPGQEVLEEAWSDAWPPEQKTQWVWEQFADKLIRETAPYGNVFFVFMDEHSYSEGNCGDHFAGFFRRRGAVWVDWDQRRAQVDWAMSPTTNGADRNAEAVAGFAREPVRPYLCLEGEPYAGEAARRAMWTFLIGGGHFLFHADSGQETPQTGIVGYDPQVPGGDRGMAPREWLGHASRFFNDGFRDLDALAPHNELVTAGQAYCLAAPGTEYALYAPRGGVVRVSLAGAGDRALTCRPYDPRTGKWGAVSEVRGEKTAEIALPEGEDWAARIGAPGL